MSPRWITPSLLALLLTACGGGGGGGASTTSQPFLCEVEPTGETYSISGTVRVAQSTLLDTDTLTLDWPVVENNGFDRAQAVPSPSTVGGLAGEGVLIDNAGSLYEDLDDFYEVELRAGATIVMEVAAAYSTSFNDLDLYLYRVDDTSQPVSQSLTAGPIEVVTAPADGFYYLHVDTWSGSSGYVLTIDGDAAVSASGARLEDDFVPDELVVKFRDDAVGVSGDMPAGLMRRFGLRHLAGGGGIMLLGLDETATGALPGPRFRDALLQRKYSTLLRLKQLRQDPAVEFVSPNYIRYPLAVTNVPSDPFYATDQWHYPLINLPEAWAVTTGDPLITVAVIDTGIKSAHPDLSLNIVPGYDFISNRGSSGDGNGIDPDPEDPETGAINHGTHVAGTVAAVANNGIGGAGVAWNASIMPLRALSSDGGTFYDIMQAMLYAAGLPNDSGTVPARRADVINMSLGGALFSPDPGEQSIIDRVRAEGVIIVAAAGNTNSQLPFYPASYEGVISVSAVGYAENANEVSRAGYSSFGPKVDIAAPGGSIEEGFKGSVINRGVLSTNGSSNYRLLSGTSMAAPHVAGVIALMQSVRIGRQPLMTPLEFDQLLAAGKVTNDFDPGATGRDDVFGYGLIDAAKAVENAASFVFEPVPATLKITPGDVVNFRADLDRLSLTASNIGGDSLIVDRVEAIGSVSWLTVRPSETVGADGLGVYLLEVDRGGLPEGDYEATVQFISSAGREFVTVSMTVDNDLRSDDIGPIQVLLLDAETLRDSGFSVQSITGGSGGYEFPAVPAGCYVIAAGTDIDGDTVLVRNGFIDAGEAWGAFPAKGRVEAIELEQDTLDVDVVVSFDDRRVSTTGTAETEPTLLPKAP